MPKWRLPARKATTLALRAGRNRCLPTTAWLLARLRRRRRVLFGLESDFSELPNRRRPPLLLRQMPVVPPSLMAKILDEEELPVVGVASCADDLLENVEMRRTPFPHANRSASVR